jgi:hypothetical protein
MPRRLSLSAEGFHLSPAFDERWNAVKAAVVHSGLNSQSSMVGDGGGSWMFGRVNAPAARAAMERVGFVAHTTPSRPGVTLLTQDDAADWSVLD